MIPAAANDSLITTVFGSDADRRGRPAEVSLPAASGGARHEGAEGPEANVQPVDTVHFSEEGKRIAQVTGPAAAGEEPELPFGDKPMVARAAPEEESIAGMGGRELNPAEQSRVDELREQDREVRRHERAHHAAAGPYITSGTRFEYETGPDGERYAVRGELHIDSSPVRGNPRETVRKMQQVRRAALTPDLPSAQDRTVARQAATIEQQAQAALAEERRAELADGRQAQAHDRSASPEAVNQSAETPSEQLPPLPFVAPAPAGSEGSERPTPQDGAATDRLATRTAELQVAQSSTPGANRSLAAQVTPPSEPSGALKQAVAQPSMHGSTLGGAIGTRLDMTA